MNTRYYKKSDDLERNRVRNSCKIQNSEEESYERNYSLISLSFFVQGLVIFFITSIDSNNLQNLQIVDAAQNLDVGLVGLATFWRLRVQV